MKYPAKPAVTDAPVIEVIQNRWSPVIFSDKALSEKEITSIFEAARWAPSSFNEQPWRYVYAGKGDMGRDILEGLLVEGNAWAKDAGLLVLGFSSKIFKKNGKPNRHYLHDTGAASALITLQATSMGLITHQMEGFDFKRANEALGVPPEFEPGSMMAVGYPGDPAKAPEKYRERDAGPRTRNPRSSFASRGKFPD